MKKIVRSKIFDFFIFRRLRYIPIKNITKKLIIEYPFKLPMHEIGDMPFRGNEGAISNPKSMSDGKTQKIDIMRINNFFKFFSLILSKIITKKGEKMYVIT